MNMPNSSAAGIPLAIRSLMFLSLILGYTGFSSHTTHSSGITSPFPSDREELTYAVTWMAIRIGTVTITTVPDPESNGDILSTAIIDSNEKLPFADVHSVIRGTMDSVGASTAFIGYDKESRERWSVVQYGYAEGKSSTLILRGYSAGISKERMQLRPVDTIPSSPATHDGLSIFYYARTHAACRESVSLQTIVQGNPGSTDLHFTGRRSTIHIDALPSFIAVTEVEGTARFKGIFGLTGGFKGWFTDDAAHIPVRAELSVLIGAVKLELTGWKRAGWTPPVP